jgi:hypothetical protein
MDNSNQKPKIGVVGVIVIIVIIMGFIGMIANGKEDHNDGKCDICGKTAVYSGDEEEYCSKHLEDAVEWYIDKSEK